MGSLRLYMLIATAGISINASAADLSTRESSEPAETVAINMGLTGASNPFSLYGDLGVLVAPWGDLNKSGFRVRFGTVDGTYSYTQHETGTRVHGLGQEGSLLFGYSINSGSTGLLMMIGGNVQHNHVDVVDPTNPVQGTAVGFKALAELYSNPTKDTMLDVQGIYSTAFNSYYVQLQYGYAAFAPEVYLGPLLVFLGDDHFNQWRIGARLSGIKIGKAELGLKAGYLRQHDQGSGAFGGVDLYVRF